MYTIKRECYTEKTFNGYKDKPYWVITFSYYKVGLNDDGIFWGINFSIQKHFIKLIKSKLQTIIKECNLLIKLK